MRNRIDKVFRENIGQQLHKYRSMRGYSLRYMAEQTGLSRVTIDNIELGTGRATDEQYKKICDVLAIPTQIRVKVSIGSGEFL